jgi:hypothetical protein
MTWQSWWTHRCPSRCSASFSLSQTRQNSCNLVWRHVHSLLVQAHPQHGPQQYCSHVIYKDALPETFDQTPGSQAQPRFIGHPSKLRSSLSAYETGKTSYATNSRLPNTLVTVPFSHVLQKHVCGFLGPSFAGRVSKEGATTEHWSRMQLLATALRLLSLITLNFNLTNFCPFTR